MSTAGSGFRVVRCPSCHKWTDRLYGCNGPAWGQKPVGCWTCWQTGKAARSAAKGESDG